MKVFRRDARQVDSTWAWVVAAAAFVLMFLGYGTAYTFGVFFQPLAETFNASRAATALVFSIVGATYSTMGIITGPAADRFGTRPVCLIGMLGLAAGLTYASQASELWQVYLGFGLGMSLGIGCVFAPANAGLQRWFTRKRGLASGMATAGVGISIIVMPPLAAAAIEADGWRETMWQMGVAVLLLGGLSAQLMGDPGSSSGGPRVATRGNAPGYALARALRSRAFVMLYLSSMLCCAGIFVPFVHLVAYASDQGLAPGEGVFLITVIGAASLVGRIVLTAASDHLGRRNSLAAMYLLMGLGFFLWWLSGNNLNGLVAFAALFGVGYGGYVGMIAPILAEYFGILRIGSMLGWFMSSVAVGGSLGPWLAGRAYDLTGSYDLPVVGVGVLGAIAAVLVMFMPARPYAASAFERDG